MAGVARSHPSPFLGIPARIWENSTLVVPPTREVFPAGMEEAVYSARLPLLPRTLKANFYFYFSIFLFIFLGGWGLLLWLSPVSRYRWTWMYCVVCPEKFIYSNMIIIIGMSSPRPFATKVFASMTQTCVPRCSIQNDVRFRTRGQRLRCDVRKERHMDVCTSIAFRAGLIYISQVDVRQYSTHRVKGPMGIPVLNFRLWTQHLELFMINIVLRSGRCFPPHTSSRV